MKCYRNLHGNSWIDAYEDHIEEMKELAKEGEGLTGLCKTRTLVDS